MKKITGFLACYMVILVFGCQKETNQKEAEQLEIPSAKKPGPSPSPSILSWQACFGTSTYDHGNDVAIAADGSSYIAGVINSTQAGVGSVHTAAAYIMKLNSNNEPAWLAPTIIDGNGHDEISSVTLTTDGGCIVAGFTYSNDLPGYAGGSDIFLAKISAAGIVEWKMAMGTAGNEKANDIIATNDNGYALTGYSDDDLMVVKLKSTATTSSADIVDWQQQYTMPDYRGNSGNSIIEWNGNYVVGGRTIAAVDASTRPLLSMISSTDGTAQQIKAFENIPGGFANTLTVNHSNTGFVLAGRQGCEALLFSVDVMGNMDWNKTFGGSGCGDIFHTMVKTTDGYLLAGVTNSKNGDIIGAKGGTDVWLFKTGTDGTRISSYNLGGKGDDRAHAIAETAGNAYMMVGTTFSNSGDVSGFKGSSDIWAMKVQLQ